MCRDQSAYTSRANCHLEEATISYVRESIRAGQITSTRLVELYLPPIKSHNGTCVNQPQGILGPITTIAHAGQINLVSTIDLRPPHAGNGASKIAKREACPDAG